MLFCASHGGRRDGLDGSGMAGISRMGVSVGVLAPVAPDRLAAWGGGGIEGPGPEPSAASVATLD